MVEDQKENFSVVCKNNVVSKLSLQLLVDLHFVANIFQKPGKCRLNMCLLLLALKYYSEYWILS